MCEERVFICVDCRAESGQGKYVEITYGTTGGWSPKWEGRICKHLDADRVLEYLQQPMKGVQT